MLSLPAKIRTKEQDVKTLRKQGFIPAVLYGPETQHLLLNIDKKTFEKIYEKARESALLQLQVEGQKPITVLIKEIQKDPISYEFLHIDFYQPKLEEKIEVKVPLTFVGEAPAVKDLGGTLVRQIQELIIKALPQNLPKEIVVDITSLKTFEDAILIKDLKLPTDVEIMHHYPEDLVAKVAEPERVEEELEKPIEEKVEEAEVVKEKTKKELEKEEE